MRYTLSDMLPIGISCWLMLSILLNRSGSLLVNFITVGVMREKRNHGGMEKEVHMQKKMSVVLTLIVFIIILMMFGGYLFLPLLLEEKV